MRTARRRSAFQLMSLVDLLMLVTFAQLAGSRQAVEESRARQQAEVAALAETVRTVTADRDRTAGTLLDAEARRTAAELVARQAAERLERAERTRDAARAEAESAATLAAERQERLTAVAALVGQSAGYLERSSRELAELSNLVDRWWVELDAGGRPTVRTDGETATLRPFRRSPTEEAEELAALPPVERARRGAEFAAAAALDLQAQLEEFSRGSARPEDVTRRSRG